MRGICIGMGGRGKMWYRWAHEAGMEAVGVVDINREILDRACDELGVPESMRFERIGQAVEATGVTVATACTASPTHAMVAHECLDAGINVIVEKPMVETAEQGREIRAKAAARGLHVAAAQNYRFNSGMLVMREALQKKDLGEVVTASVIFTRWRPSRGLTLPLMNNQSIHHFDGLRWILGEDPEWCFAKSWDPDWNDCDGPTVVEAIYGFTGGTIVTYSGSYVAQGVNMPYSGLWRIEGSTGRLEYQGDANDHPAILHRRDPEERTELRRAVDIPNGSVQVCKEFLEALEKGETPPTDSSDNVKSLALGWAADLSSREDRVVRIEEVI